MTTRKDEQFRKTGEGTTLKKNSDQRKSRNIEF
jgi:hypothetical protein